MTSEATDDRLPRVHRVLVRAARRSSGTYRATVISLLVVVHGLLTVAAVPVLLVDPDPALAFGVWIVSIVVMRRNRHVLDPLCCDAMRRLWAINLTPLLILVQVVIDWVVPTLGSAMVLIGHCQTVDGARRQCECPNARVVR
jgi:hypothetical protein